MVSTFLSYNRTLVMGSLKTLAIEAIRIVTARGSAYRNKPGQVWGVPVWEFARGGKGK